MAATPERFEPAKPPSLKFKKAAVLGRHLWELTKLLLRLLKNSFLNGHGKAHLKLLAFQGGRAYQRFVREFTQSYGDFGDLFSERLEKLRVRTEGLHSLLPAPSPVTGYSVLIPVYKPNADFLKKAIRSVLSQSAPNMEILIGLDGPQPSAVTTALDDIKRDFPKAKIICRVFDSQKRRGISETTNELARNARFSHLLFMDHDDWIRPDLLYRYELSLRMSEKPNETVLYCNEFKINERDEVLPGSHFSKPATPPFPYFFQNLVTHCMLVPKSIFEKAGALRAECDGAQDYDLCLRMELAGAQFQNVPFYLYAWRAHPESTAYHTRQKYMATEAGAKALGEYAKAKSLSWDVSEGMRPTTYRAIPQLKPEVPVHVVMLYKDRREITLRAARKVLDQKGVKIILTAVDNNSDDRGIKDALADLGAEVIRVDEPFNYSRLNNIGVARSRISTGAELVLFLNNDVELDEGALCEMARWIYQPGIGAVGCRLRYPDGRLQHGGVDLDRAGPADTHLWSHTENGYAEELLARTAVLRICDAVTAACLLMKRSLFDSLGGFDELQYPIGYSDTNLCRKIQKVGGKILYTPYATGVHHEGATRGIGAVEDYEASSWLDARTLE